MSTSLYTNLTTSITDIGKQSSSNIVDNQLINVTKNQNDVSQIMREHIITTLAYVKRIEGKH